MPLLKTLIIVCVVLVEFGNARAQFRIADARKDIWSRDDKAAHLFGNYFGIDLARHYLSDKEAIPLLLAAGVMWEVKDGFVPYEKFGFWGGEGFSTKDIAAGAVGIGLNYLVHGVLYHKSPTERDRQARERLGTLRKNKNFQVIAR